MDRAEHYRAAERLLEKAGKEQDSIRLSLILAEAQVHATLAVGAAPETGTGSEGGSEVGGGQGAGEVWPTGSAYYDPLPPYGHPAPSGRNSPEESSRRYRDPTGPAGMQQTPAAPPLPEPRWRQPLRPPRQQGPVPARPRTIRGNSVEEEPDPEEQEPGGPEQEPGAAEQETRPARRPPSPGGPGAQEPGGGFRPF